MAGERYTGPLGRTRRERLLYTCPSGVQVSVLAVSQIDAQSDPQLLDELLAGEPAATATCPETGERHRVDVPVIVHDFERRLLALVLPPSQRHRELAARAELFAELAAAVEHPVPDYARRAEVVFGARGLAALLRRLEEEAGPSAEEKRLEEVGVELEAKRRQLDERSAELEARRRQLDGRAAELERFEAQLSQRAADLERRESAIPERRAELDRRESALSERGAELDRREAELAARLASPQAASPRPATATIPVPGPPPTTSDDTNPGEPATSPFDPVDEEDITASGVSPFADEGQAIEIEALDPDEVVEDDEVLISDQMLRRVAAVSDNSATQVTPRTDSLIERWIASREPSSVGLDDAGRVRVAIAAPADTLEGLLSSDLKVLLQLHRLETYPLVTLSVGTRESFTRGRPNPATLFFDVGDEADRAALSALAEDFSFQMDLFDTEYLPVRKRTITAGLAANVQYLLTAADDMLGRLEEGSRSLSRALIRYDDPSYDRFGREHPERNEFREDVLADLSRPSRVRRALHMCRRFSTPEGEEYLLFVRGFPLRLWHKRRRAVLERALDHGLWMGKTLSRIAVSEQLAASRKDLVKRLAKRFVNLVADPKNHDLDEEAVRENWSTLTDELRDLGFEPDEVMSPRTEPIDSGQLDSASGTIGHVTALIEAGGLSRGRDAGDSGTDLESRGTDDLVAMLSDRDRRHRAALALCRREQASTVAPLFETLRGMTRAEAGDVFGSLVRFGDVVVPHLVETLTSRKGFLRQGAALALAALGSEKGLEPVCDLLLSEPTEIWKEVARALGDYGGRAVMPLVARLRQRPDAGERVAWALAHIASRGHRHPITTLAGGRDVVAAGVARHALELADLAGSDNRSIWSPRPGGREHTVKRAFSRRVLEALPGRADARDPRDLSSPAMLLSEADLIDAAELDDDIEPLDESDLLPS